MTDLSRADLGRFAELFVDERSRFYRKVPGSADFHHQRSWLKDEYLRDHLLGKYWVACLRASETRILSVDLDCHQGPASQAAMVDGYRRIRELMPKPIVFRSSNSGGLHLYWILDAQVPTFAALAMVARHLRENGVRVGRQSCDLRPTPTTCLRLPLGAQSVLLDPERLSPLPLRSATAHRRSSF